MEGRPPLAELPEETDGTAFGKLTAENAWIAESGWKE
jgi:hypothetical protein